MMINTSEPIFLIMRKLTASILFCGFSLGAVYPAQAEAQRDEIVRRVKASIDGHVTPRLKSLSQHAVELHDAVTEHCDMPSESTLERAKERFAATVIAWAGVEHLRFGPFSRDSRNARISFWPDPRGIVRRHLRRALNKMDEAILQPGRLAKKSAALQGLAALEHLLPRLNAKESAASGDAAAHSFQCKFASAIAKNVSELSHAIRDEWLGPGGWRSNMLNAGPGNPAYRSPQEALAEFVKAQLYGLQIARERQIVLLYDAAQKGGRLHRLPYYVSGLSKEYLATQLESSSELNEKLELSTFLPKEKEWQQDWISTAYHVLNREIVLLQIPKGGKVAQGALNLQNLRALRFYTNGLRQIIGKHVAPAAGLTIGFNELDGD